jgi:hypothetical protein
MTTAPKRDLDAVITDAIAHHVALGERFEEDDIIEYLEIHAPEVVAAHREEIFHCGFLAVIGDLMPRLPGITEPWPAINNLVEESVACAARLAWLDAQLEELAPYMQHGETVEEARAQLARDQATPAKPAPAKPAGKKPPRAAKE